MNPKKIIVIGIDGGDSAILESFNLPFWNAIKQRGFACNVHVDNHARGWIPILTGMGPDQTAALYTTIQNNSYLTSNKFSIEVLAGNPTVKPVWKRANELGVKFGTFLVPTTLPSTPVDGFYLAGGGGWQALTWPAMGYPASLQQKVGSKPLDVRIDKKPYSNFTAFISELNDLTVRTTDLFLSLMQEFDVDIAFKTFVGADRIQHLLFGNLIEISKGNSPPLAQAITEHYSILDSSIQRIQEAYPEAAFMFVSDHGHEASIYDMNINALMSQGGFIKQRNFVSGGIFRKLRTLAKKYMSPQLRRKLRLQSNVSQSGLSASLADPYFAVESSKAFAVPVLKCAFVNERGRYPNGQIDANDTPKVVNDLVAFFNERLSVYPNASAREYRSQFPDAPFEKLLPDVVIDFPTSTSVNTLWPEAVHDCGPVAVFNEQIPNPIYHTGIHSTNCIFGIQDAALIAMAKDIGMRNSTDIYRLLDRWMQS